MKAIATGIFRGMYPLDAYSFKNKKGEDINVKAKMEIKFDEVDTEGVIVERTVKIDAEQVELIDKLKLLDYYQEAIFEFDVEIKSFQNKQDIKLKLVDVEANMELKQ